MDAAKKQIVESTKEEPSWFEFIHEIILVLALYSAHRRNSLPIHRYSYVGERSSTLIDRQSDQEAEVVDMAKKEALLTGLTEVGKLVEEKEGF